MKTEIKGWVIINENHPSGAKPFVIASTFSQTRKECIENFIIGTGHTWGYWHRDFNFSCVKAKSTVETI